MKGRVIVTGGVGYIGRATCAALRIAGFQPFSMDIRNGYDVRDPVGIAGVIAVLRPVGLIHLAAHSDVAESVREPEKYWQNVLMSAAVAQAAQGLPVVLASSAAVYGEGGPGRIDEYAPLAPINPYGHSKAASEALLPKAMRLRYFNVAGDHDPNRQHLAPSIMAAAATGTPISVHGNCVRDYVDVRDVALANVLALEALLAGRPGLAVNICSGQGASVVEVIAACEIALVRAVPTVFGPPRAGDPQRLVGSNKRAALVLGWEPRFRLLSTMASAVLADKAA